MRYIPDELKNKINSAYQTIYNNANPSMDISLMRPKSSVTDSNMFYVETIRQGENLEDIGIDFYVPVIDEGIKKIYEIHKINNVIGVSSKVYTATPEDEWEEELILGEGIRCRLCFDGLWQKRVDGTYAFITIDYPWIFWTDLNNNLYAQKWDDEQTKYKLSENVVKIDAKRCWKNVMVPTDDQGIVVAYIKSDGYLYYRAYAMQGNLELGWEIERQVTFSLTEDTFVNVSVVITNDYRCGFVAETSQGEMYLKLSKRNWAGMAIEQHTINFDVNTNVSLQRIYYIEGKKEEYISANIDCLVAFLYGLSPVPLSANNVEATIIYIDFDYEIKAFTSIENPSSFSVEDENQVSFNVGYVEKTGDKQIKLTCVDFNAAYGDMTVEYDGQGNIYGPVHILDAFLVSFTPVGLIPPVIEPPVPTTAYNVEEF